MSSLNWSEFGLGDFIATGAADTYLIVRDEFSIVLTRWASDIQDPRSVAAVAAQHCIRMRGTSAADAAVATRHFKLIAQEYEAGISVEGQPAWHHGYRGRAAY